jgi:flagellar motor switch protein FliN
MSTDINRRSVLRDAHELVRGTRPTRRIDASDHEEHSDLNSSANPANPVNPANVADERLGEVGDVGEGGGTDQDGQVDFRIELGRTALAPEKLDELRQGCLLTLDNEEQDPVEIFVQGRLVAWGEIVVLDDRFGVRVTQLVASPGT